MGADGRGVPHWGRGVPHWEIGHRTFHPDSTPPWPFAVVP